MVASFHCGQMFIYAESTVIDVYCCLYINYICLPAALNVYDESDKFVC